MCRLLNWRRDLGNRNTRQREESGFLSVVAPALPFPTEGPRSANRRLPSRAAVVQTLCSTGRGRNTYSAPTTKGSATQGGWDCRFFKSDLLVGLISTASSFLPQKVSPSFSWVPFM